MKKQTFIQGTMILLAAGIINRILGFIPRIILPRVIGAEGVGLYQQGYPFFIVIVTLITGGLPLAIAKLVAEAESLGNNGNGSSEKILRVSLMFTLSLGVLFTTLCIIFAPWVTSTILTDERVYHTFVSMTPMILIIAVSSVYRGYFQGKQNMIPSAASSIAETLMRILCVLWFSYLLLPRGIEYAAAGAMLGAVAGELIGMIVLLWQHEKYRKAGKTLPSLPSSPAKQSKGQQKSIFKKLMAISIPVTAGRLVGSLSYLLETIVTAQSLALAGLTKALATAQYGALQGMVIPLLLLPGALTSSLATSLVPSLSEAAARKDYKTIHKRLHQSLRLALVTGGPFAVVMYVLAEPLCRLLYDDGSIADMLKTMTPFALFIYVQAPLQAALQALDRPGRALINTTIGAVIKITLILTLASRPEYGIYGAVIAICVNSLIVTLLHGQSLRQLLGFRFRWLDLIKVAAGMVIMAGVAQYLFIHLPWTHLSFLQFAVSSWIGLIVYLAVMAACRLIDLHDLSRVPFIGSWISPRK
ncbi:MULTISPECIES: stage V sporulation protein B [unclassified Paenibacillus]|uniref:Stage V sporulation protein B n=1 Tax=Paenibacillus provencensis TaxID=441151 RepID=A0ABW3Q277_9BACL|nr:MULTISPECIES: stage V sporulation protein B [unclassified Paenibacillus]MCM3129965.1 stage V sporulation protein B [Paenibacillus sp. MER 78]SFS62281.1 stage V sporulation protein B [Paenibacillus sp. 453mf]